MLIVIVVAFHNSNDYGSFKDSQVVNHVVIFHGVLNQLRKDVNNLILLFSCFPTLAGSPFASPCLTDGPLSGQGLGYGTLLRDK